MQENIFIRYACCIAVQGYVKSIIYDFNRETYYPIPNDLCHILRKYNKKKIKEIYNKYPLDAYPILDEYFRFLENNEIIFYANQCDAKLFPELSKHFETPSIISNAVIDVCNDTDLVKLSKVIESLETLLCEAVQIKIITEGVLHEKLHNIINTFKNSSITYLELALPYSEYWDIDNLNRVANKENRINNIYIYNSPDFHVANFEDRPFGKIIYLSESHNECIIDPNFLFVNYNLFCESHVYNNYFNKKIFIDTDFNIRNAPATARIWGNILQTDAMEIINNPSFKNLWFVHKDIIKTCCDCEYRYMCVDKRVPIKSTTDNSWYFESPCNYNPYKGIWNK